MNPRECVQLNLKTAILKMTSKIFNDSTAYIYIYSETTIIHTCLKIHLIKNIIQNDKINNNLYIEYNIVKGNAYKVYTIIQ